MVCSHQSLVAAVDELLELIENWNLTFASSSDAAAITATKSNTPHLSSVSGRKRRMVSSDAASDSKSELFAHDELSDEILPSKKTKLNSSKVTSEQLMFGGSPVPNNEWNLESVARLKCQKLVRSAIAQQFAEVEISDEDFQSCIVSKLGRPRKPEHGEIAIPCFMISKKVKSKPAIVASSLAEAMQAAVLLEQDQLKQQQSSNDETKSEETSSVFEELKQAQQNEDLGIIESVTADNGYINVRLSAEFISRVVPKILQPGNSLIDPLPSTDPGSISTSATGFSSTSDSDDSNNSVRGRKVMIEYSQPNTHKAFHVGHMRNVALGDSLVRLFKHCGAKVTAVNYFGDEGAHVAACVWLLQKMVDENGWDLSKPETFIPSDENRGEWLGNMYVESKKRLDLGSYASIAIKGAIVGQIQSKEKHPSAEAPSNWHVCSVKISEDGTCKTVVCGGSHYEVGDYVPYLPVGAKYKKASVVIADKKGVESNGVILGALECGVRLPPLPEEEVKEESAAATEDGSSSGGKKSKKSSKKKKKKKGKSAPDQRILILNDYGNERVPLAAGTLLSELTRDFEASAKAGIPDDQTVEDAVSKFDSEMREVLRKLEEGDEEAVRIWKETGQWSLDEFKKIYEWIEAHFDYDFTESQVSETSQQIVRQYYDDGVFELSDGAIGCNLKKYNLPFWLLIKRDGSGLYAAKDIALAKRKFDEFDIDSSIYVVGAEQSLHFQQLFATLKHMGYKQADQCYHVSYGLVVLPTGKMAARKGTAILFSELTDMLKKEVNQQYLDKLREKTEDPWTEEELSEAERKISVGTIRYGMLNHDTNKDIVFELSKWALSSGNTGPYLQYQCARINSIARKVSRPDGVDADYSVLSGETERQLLFLVSQFQSKVNEVCLARNPSTLCDYTFAIAQSFSQWYNRDENNILKCEDPVRKATMLDFSQSIAMVMRKCLNLLGVPVLERM